MAPGDLAIFRRVPDQPRWVSQLEGKLCIVVRNLTEADGVYSSHHIWDVLVDGKLIRIHTLDVEVLR